MQPAFYDDSFRSFFPPVRQGNGNMPMVSAMPVQHQTLPLPPPISVQTVDHVQNALAQFQEKLFADLNAWKQSTAASLAETSRAAPLAQAQPPSIPAAFYPPVMHAPYLYQQMPPQQLAVEKPATDNPAWKPLSCSNLPSAVLWFMLIIFFVVVVVLILVYLAKLTVSVNSMSAAFMAKSRGER